MTKAEDLRARNAAIMGAAGAPADAASPPPVPAADPTETGGRAGQRIVAYMTPGELEHAKAAAARERLSLSAWARRALLEAADASAHAGRPS